MSNSEIVNDGSPKLTIKKEVTAEISCPNCDQKMVVKAADVDIGHIIKCSSCNHKTYYPFEKPFYKQTKLILGYIASLIVSFLLGLLVNFTTDKIKNADSSTAVKKIENTQGDKHVN